VGEEGKTNPPNLLLALDFKRPSVEFLFVTNLEAVHENHL